MGIPPMNNWLPFFIVGGIIIALFVNPKSRLKRYCCRISGKLSIQRMRNGRMNAEVGDKYISIYVAMRTLTDIQVDRISFRIGRKNLPSDWQPKVIQGDELGYVNFPRPDWLHRGEYSGHLIAYTPEGFTKSERIGIMVE